MINAASLRQLTIMERLYIYKTSENVMHLANELGCVQSTIVQAVEDINAFYNVPKIMIDEQSKNLVYEMIVDFDDTSIYRQFYEQQIEFEILEAIFYDSTYLQGELAERFHMSESTLKRTINRVNKSLKLIGFQINSNPYRFHGQESNIQNFFVQYFLEKQKVDNIIYAEVQRIFSLIEHITIEKFDIAELHGAESLGKMMLFVSLIRYSQGARFRENAQLLKFNQWILTNIAAEEWDVLASHLKIEIDQEMVGNVYFFLSPEILFNSGVMHLEVSELLLDIAEAFELEITSKYSTVYASVLSTCFINYRNNSFILYDQHQHFYTRMQMMFPNSTSKLNDLVVDYLLRNQDYLENNYLKWNESGFSIEGFAQFIIWTVVGFLPGLVGQIEAKEDKLTIALVVDSISDENRYVVKRIMSLFAHSANFVHFQNPDEMLQYKGDVRGCITDQKNEVEIPTLRIESRLIFGEIHRISNFIELLKLEHA
ncbi:helix-turn-helix domain-containing protein [Erysipelothrix sp. HDW6C]|uniref:helix-turn-helix domain-containing protein n=1 Tax=Erysipelothrix sp. HDW6C TaxID=2714930 RepID=UPI001F100606|nr:helix-turn-helix domain-containing protein [Erysipelothrix sp. HDW6C]